MILINVKDAVIIILQAADRRFCRVLQNEDPLRFSGNKFSILYLYKIIRLTSKRNGCMF